MIKFSAPVDLRWDDSLLEFIVLSPFTVDYKEPGHREMVFTIPVGFTTDLASIPRWATVIVPKLGHHLQPAVAHDFCYENGVPDMSKKEADRIFYVGCLKKGVRWTRARLMYNTVVIGGSGK